MHALDPYDAVLLVSFGGPDGPDEVMPFLERVTAGRAIPVERLQEVSRHYFEYFDGRSPINAANRGILADLGNEFSRRGWQQPLTWGNRNAAPFLADALRELSEAGARRVAALLTSAYPSYSSCRQYRENLHDALTETGSDLVIDVVTPYAHRSGFAQAQVDAVIAAVKSLSVSPAWLLFVTHSIPTSMDERSGPQGGAYQRWHQDLAQHVTATVAERLGWTLNHDLAFCSRSGPPRMPWLEPDVNDRIRELAAAGEASVVVVPFGFISDHVEVAYDLDIEAAATAQEVGMEFARAATVGSSGSFVTMLGDVLAERAAVARGEMVAPQLINGGEAWTPCAVECCENARSPQRPAVMH